VKSSEHMARCQAMRGGVTESEAAVIADLTAAEVLTVQMAKSATKEQARAESAEALLVEARAALVKGGILLEILAAQIAIKPYAELTTDFQDHILQTVQLIRALLARLARKEGT